LNVARTDSLGSSSAWADDQSHRKLLHNQQNAIHKTLRQRRRTARRDRKNDQREQRDQAHLGRHRHGAV